MGSQYTFDEEKFVVTLGSGWNIPVDLMIGPHMGISYATHPQAKPTRVTDFQDIERISTSILNVTKDSTTTDSSNGEKSASINNGKIVNTPPAIQKTDKKVATCNCNDVKSLLKIRVTGNVEDLTISCNGLKTADNIADLVDGYCRIVNNTEASLWDRNVTKVSPNNSATNSMEKNKQHHSLPALLVLSQPIDAIRGDSIDNGDNGQLVEMRVPILSEDYVELGLGEEEGDYSTPAVRNYELDRSQITLSDIIGVGQFGDVHIGTCRVNKPAKTSPASVNDDSSLKDDVPSANDSTDNGDSSGTKIIHVAVKTCKADADMLTAEKFLEEACKLLHFRYGYCIEFIL